MKKEYNILITALLLDFPLSKVSRSKAVFLYQKINTTERTATKYRVTLLPLPCMPLADGGSNLKKNDLTDPNPRPITKMINRLLTHDTPQEAHILVWGCTANLKQCEERFVHDTDA